MKIVFCNTNDLKSYIFKNSNNKTYVVVFIRTALSTSSIENFQITLSEKEILLL